MLPRVPGEEGLRFPGDQPPTEGTNVVPLRNWQDSLNGATRGTSQVLGAQNRPALRDKLGDAALELRRLPVVVECDHVGVVELNAADRAAASAVCPLAVPHAAGQR